MAASAGLGGPGAAYWVVPSLSAAAVWLTYLIGRRCADAASGAAAALTPPNLAPLAALAMAAVLAHAYSRRRGPRTVLRTAIVDALPLAAAASLAWLNARLYGSPFLSGYGTAAGLFASGNVPVNPGRDPRWRLDTQTPVVLLGLAAPFMG
jgi:hypothetical protein